MEDEIQDATDLAEARADYWLMVPGAKALRGPVGKREMRELVSEIRNIGHPLTVLKAVEVYE